MTDSQRNFLIILAVVLLAMFFAPVAGGLAIFSRLVTIAFVIVTGMFLLLMYQRHSDVINRMEIGPRIALIGSGLMLFVVTLTGMLVPGWAAGDANTLVFFVLLFACGFGMVWGWSQRNSW